MYVQKFRRAVIIFRNFLCLAIGLCLAQTVSAQKQASACPKGVSLASALEKDIPLEAKNLALAELCGASSLELAERDAEILASSTPCYQQLNISEEERLLARTRERERLRNLFQKLSDKSLFEKVVCPPFMAEWR